MCEHPHVSKEQSTPVTGTNEDRRASFVSDRAVKLPKPNLTEREIEVLLRWFRCDSKPAVAADLFLSLGTVNTHLTRVRQKYAAVGRPAPTKASLVARAVQDGLVDIDEL